MFVENKEQFKDYLKIAGMRIIGILLPVLIMFIYLVVNGAIKDFVNYAILGISTFSNKIKYVKLFSNDKIEIRILSVLMPVSIIIMSMILIIANILKKENKNLINLLTILVYSLSIIIVMYPISDEIHFLIGGLIAIIGLIYVTFLLCKIIYDKIKINKKFKIYKLLTSLICVIVFGFILKTMLSNIYDYMKIEKNVEISHYKNIEVSENLVERIKNMDN